MKFFYTTHVHLRGKTTLSLLHTHIYKSVYTRLPTHSLQDNVVTAIGVRIFDTNKKMDQIWNYYIL